MPVSKNVRECFNDNDARLMGRKEETSRTVVATVQKMNAVYN